jgi:hypothetical protein
MSELQPVWCAFYINWQLNDSDSIKMYNINDGDDEGMCGSCLNENWQGKPKYIEKTCLSDTLQNSHVVTWD